MSLRSTTLAIIILVSILPRCIKAETCIIEINTEPKHELRFGILQHDTDIKLGHRYERGIDLNLEWLFHAPKSWSWIEYISSPRIHTGLTKNTRGSTDTLYSGLTWHWNRCTLFFIEGSLSALIHNGKRNNCTQRKNCLGTRILFRESISLGYKITQCHNVSVILEHASNGSISRHNPGLTNAGLKYGYIF